MTGITNPAEEYFKDGFWGWAATVWEKLVSSGGRLFTALHGWDGDSWQKLPLVWGYSDRYAEREANDDVGAGNITQTFSTVPEGEIWVITSFGAYSKQTNVTHMYMKAMCGGVILELASDAYTVAYKSISPPTPIILKKDDFLEVAWFGAGAGDDFRSSANGYKMLIAE